MTCYIQSCSVRLLSDWLQAIWQGWWTQCTVLANADLKLSDLLHAILNSAVGLAAGNLAGLLDTVQKMIVGKADKEELQAVRRLLGDKVDLADHQVCFWAVVLMSTCHYRVPDVEPGVARQTELNVWKALGSFA